MTRVLYSCWFGNGLWERMAGVLERSARYYCPEWSIVVERIESEARTSYVSNSVKLAQWVKACESLPDGAELLLIDSDCYVRGNLDALWEASFDVAFTRKKESGHLPFNAGVVAIRLSDASRAFMREWLRVNDSFLLNREEHKKWEAKYGGINQAALGAILEKGRHGIAIAWLPAAQWNCCHAPLWEKPGAIVHIKSHLRQQVIRRVRTGPWAPIINEWRQWHAE